MSGFTAATAGGALGAIGAVLLIYAFRAGGLPTYVMPIVFGGAPVVNTIFSMVLHPPKTAPHPMMWAGMALVVAGASLVLYFQAALVRTVFTGVQRGQIADRQTLGARSELRRARASAGNAALSRRARIASLERRSASERGWGPASN